MELDQPINNKDIIAYYQETLSHYWDGWMDRSNLGMHFGFVDEHIQDHAESLSNTNRVLSNLAGITDQDLVLDAGCGLGGSALWLAKNKGASVVGISLDQNQLQEAKQYVVNEDVERLVEYVSTDFLNASFAPGKFDVFWVIESMCHASSKKAFVREVSRVLKSGGRFIASEYFQVKDELSKDEAVILSSWLSSWAIPHLPKRKEFINDLMEEGFKDIKFIDVTKNVVHSVVRLRLLAEQNAHLTDRNLNDDRASWSSSNIRGSLDLFDALSRNLWVYGMLLAYKL